MKAKKKEDKQETPREAILDHPALQYVQLKILKGFREVRWGLRKRDKKGYSTKTKIVMP